jgi:hypothetical protein
MTTRNQDTWLQDSGWPGADGSMSAGGPAGEMVRSRAALAEMEATFASVSASVIDRLLSSDHERFLRSVRQSGGQ